MAYAVTATVLTSGSDSTAGTTATTASITPTANRLVLAAIGWVDATSKSVTSLSGNSLTWVEMHDGYRTTSPYHGYALYRTMGASPTSGSVTITMAGTTDYILWSIVEFGDVDTSGTNGSGAVVQSLEGIGYSTGPATVTLAAFGSSNNRPYSMLVLNNDLAITPESGYTEFHEVQVAAANLTLQTQWHPSITDTTPSASWASGTLVWSIIGVEIKAAAAAAARTQVLVL